MHKDYINKAIKVFDTEYKKLKIIPKLEAENSTYNFAIGGRNGHKSTEMQIALLYHYLHESTQFLLIRRKTNNTVNVNWFTPYFKKLLKKAGLYIDFKKKLIDSDKYTGYFLIGAIDDIETEEPAILGKVCFLSVEQTYRSNENELLDKLHIAVLEECITKDKKEYLLNEPQLLVDTISTQMRSKQCKVFLIGNTNAGQENNPYFHYFEIDNYDFKTNDLLTFKPGENLAQISLYLPPNFEANTELEYQKIKGNTVGTTGEWLPNKRLMQEPLNNLEAEYEFLNVIINYRNKQYYFYNVTGNGYKRKYYYITTEKPTIISANPLNLDEFRSSLPPSQQDFKNNLLRYLYPNKFKINENTGVIEFIPSSINEDIEIININDSYSELEKAKQDYYYNIDKIIQMLTQQYYFCSSKALLYWLQENIKEYLKEG